jgi:hypothetical protein
MLRRPTAIVLVITLLPLLSCTSTKTQEIGLPTDQEIPAERITSITTHEGEVLHFVEPGATLQRDTVFGQVGQEYRGIAIDDVERLWVTRTQTNTLATVGLVVVVVGGLLLVVAAAAAIASAFETPKPRPEPREPVESCPFVYSWDGTQYVFDAEPYGGAITRGLERDDFAELESLVPDEDGRYRLKITNEAQETQYTNLMELWVVDHAPGTRIAADEFGTLYTVRDIQPPMAATDASRRDLREWLAATDQRIWEPMPVADERGELRQNIVLTFPKPVGATTAKLVANVATGLWGSHMIREMLELHGSAINEWYARIDGNPASRDSLFAWILQEELFRLKIFVEEPTGWEVRGTLHGGGPFIAEDRVVPLDLSRVEGETLRIRIQPPLGFWALNSFAVDYTPEVAFDMEVIQPIEARDGSGADVLATLLAADDAYYEMPRNGDFGYVVFPAPKPVPGMERTVLLHSSGYYLQHLDSRGEPNQALLRAILEVPGTAVRLAAGRYAEWRENAASRQ